MPIIFLELCLKCPFFYECDKFDNPKCKGKEKEFRKLMKNWRGLEERAKLKREGKLP